MTRSQIETMDEATLRGNVLIPLFLAMGFRNVRHYHGGVLELGKDIIMWKPDEFGTRVNYAVVVKASGIRGNIVGKNSFTEVLTQIQQCFGNEFLDQKTLENQRIGRCFVVTSKEFSKEAQNAIKGPLQTVHLDRLTTFIGGDDLWQLLQQHLGSKTILGNLEQVQQGLKNLSPDFEVAVKAGENHTHVMLVPRNNGGTNKPSIRFKSKFDFPRDKDGMTAFEAVNNHVAKGLPATIPGKFVKDVCWPEPISQIIAQGLTIESLSLGEIRSSKRFLLKVEAETHDKAMASLTIELKNVRIGAKEALYSNAHQNLPWRFELLVAAKVDHGTLSFMSNYLGFPVHLELDGARFERCLAKGGRLKVIDLETGLLFANGEVPAGTANGGPPDGWISMLEMLVVIQDRTQTTLRLPTSRQVFKQELYLISQVYEIVSVGMCQGRAISLTLPLSWDLAQKFVSAPTGSLELDFHEQDIEVLETKLSLGPKTYLLKDYRIDESDLTVIKEQIAARAEVIPVNLMFESESALTVIYSKWYKRDAD